MYRTCCPDDVENQTCFQILGFDIMLDADLKPWLIEVNHAPSLATESVFDVNIKQKLLRDTISLLNLSLARKQHYIQQTKQAVQLRMVTGKKVKSTPQEKEEKRREANELRDIQEQKLRGGFELIFPLADTPENEPMIEKYTQFLDTARDQYDYFNSGRRKSDIIGEVQNKQLLQQAHLHQKPMWSGQGLPPGH